jgi:RNA polymerase sigma factor (sigma-70 family)
VTDLRIMQYRPLVLNQSRRYYPFVKALYTRDDLVAVGMAAVWRSTVSWQPLSDYTFGQYASAAVRNAMRAVLLDCEKQRRLGKMIVVDDTGESPFDELETGDQDAFLSTAQADRGVIEHEISAALSLALGRLRERERVVIKRRFFEEKTLEEVGQEMGVTRERVRQIEARAIRRLRKDYHGEELLACA